MNDLIKMVGIGVAVVGTACVAGIHFFETTKKVGQVIVDVSDAGINSLTKVKTSLESEEFYNKVRSSIRSGDDFYQRLRNSL